MSDVFVFVGLTIVFSLFMFWTAKRCGTKVANAIGELFERSSVESVCSTAGCGGQTDKERSDAVLDVPAAELVTMVADDIGSFVKDNYCPEVVRLHYWHKLLSQAAQHRSGAEQ